MARKNTEMDKFYLTNREHEIMTILWNSPDGMIASEIVRQHPELSINTVQSVLKKLHQRNLIEVGDIVYSGTVLCRKYRPTISESDFMMDYIAHGIYNLDRFEITPFHFLYNFIDKIHETITPEENSELLAILREISVSETSV